MTEPYEFVIENDDQDWFRLEFRPFDDNAQQWFSGVWQRLSGSLEKSHKLAGTNSPEWVHWKPWDWCKSKRPGYESRLTVVAWCGFQVAGFLNVWPNFASQHGTGQTTLYLEHMAATPGNQTTELWNRRYRHVGVALLAYAVKVSQDTGYDGRLSLHAASDSALAFYRKIAENRTPPLFYDERTGIRGPTPHAARSDAELTYLETTPEGAMNFLEDYGHE